MLQLGSLSYNYPESARPRARFKNGILTRILVQNCTRTARIFYDNNVLDETYLALELEHDVLDSLSSTSCPSELTTVFQSIAIQIALTWIQIYHVIWEHKA